MVFDIFGDIFGTFTMMFFGFFIFVIFIVIIGVSFACRAGSSISRTMPRGRMFRRGMARDHMARMARFLTIEAPPFVIPDEYRGQKRSDGTEIKTVRLPDRCPSCNAAISHEGIDWTGPLEAKCNYCGGTLRATFESV